MPALDDPHAPGPDADSAPENATTGHRSLPDHELTRFWWLYLPLAFFAMRWAIHSLSDSKTGLESWFINETGVVENLTVFLLLVALGVTICVLYRFNKELHFLPRIFLLFYCLGCVYFAGEEASWGQHWFGWETGDFFYRINDQQETNFHNTSIFLDRLPKSIVSLLIFIGGVVVPIRFMLHKRSIDYQDRFWWLLPTSVCLPTAVIATIATWPSKIERAIDFNFYFDQAQEIKELYIALFILLFVVSLYLRLSDMRRAGKHFSPL